MTVAASLEYFPHFDAVKSPSVTGGAGDDPSREPYRDLPIWIFAKDIEQPANEL